MLLKHSVLSILTKAPDTQFCKSENIHKKPYYKVE